MSDNITDDFIEGFLSGNDKIISVFYTTYFPGVKSYILKNSGTEADARDIFQDALVLTYQKLRSDRLRLECSLATYIFAVSRNLWMNTLRKRQKEVSWDKIPEISEHVNTGILEHIHNQEKQALYQKYFLHLSAECQQILRHLFSKKSMAEISNIMNYSLGYTRKKKFDCKKQLITLLEKDPAYIELRHEPSKERES